MAFSAARRIMLTLAAVAIALSVGLAAPTPARACLGCGPSWQQFYDASDTIVLARYLGRSGRLSSFEVVDVLKGRSSRTLRLQTADDLGRPRVWSLWILTPYERRVSVWSFRVDPDGSVLNMEVGEGYFADYPRTLAGWYRALGLRPPDTSTAGAGPPGQPAPGPSLPPPLLLVAALLGGAAALRRLRGARPPEPIGANGARPIR